MPRCLYCHKEIGEAPIFQLDNDGGFCCSESCKKEAAAYMARSRKYKGWYLLMIILSLGLWACAFFSALSLSIGGAALIVCGVVGILFPFGPRWAIDFLGMERTLRAGIYFGTFLVVVGILSVLQ